VGASSEWYRKTLLAVTGTPLIEKLSTTYGKRLASRFVAGDTLAGALEETLRLNKSGIMATLDHLGEGIRELAEAEGYRERYLELLDGIGDRKLTCGVSLKPTQMGLALDAAVCYANIREVVKRARRSGTFVCIDMENTPYTQATIDMVRRMRKEGLTNVGTVLQAYLRRTAEDAELLLRDGITVRLVKGAYKEAAEVAFQKKTEVLDSFKELIARHFEQGVYAVIASHDDAIIEWVKSYARTHNIPKSSFEFQMLYGLRMSEQANLARDGYRIRCYVPYGEMWYPYFTRRLAEKPANLLLVLRHMSAKKR
jgi:proline dehydrogenase